MIVKKIFHTEHHHQAHFVSWFRKQHSTIIFSIPNGGLRSKGVAMKMKLEGTMRGVPDLFVPEWRLFIEMKREDKDLSSTQEELRETLESYGYTVIVGKGFEGAKKAVDEFLRKQ